MWKTCETHSNTNSLLYIFSHSIALLLTNSLTRLLTVCLSATNWWLGNLAARTRMTHVLALLLLKLVNFSDVLRVRCDNYQSKNDKSTYFNETFLTTQHRRIGGWFSKATQMYENWPTAGHNHKIDGFIILSDKLKVVRKFAKVSKNELRGNVSMF